MFPRLVYIEKSDAATGQRYKVYFADQFVSSESGFTQPPAELSREEASQLLALDKVPKEEIKRILQRVDEEGSASVELKPRIGHRIVRAWFDTVINPLIEALESELVLAFKGNWTWRFRPPSLEMIRPARRYLERTAVASLDQICDLEPETGRMILSHDDRVKALLESASALHDALAGSPVFIGLCDSFWSPEALASAGLRDIQDIIGGYAFEDRYNLIAQYMVNNVDELPEYYATAKFWNLHRAALRGALHDPGIRPRLESLAEAGRSLTKATQDLLERLKRLRLELSLEHDVPYAVGAPASVLS